MNLLSLVILWLDNICQIQMKMQQCPFYKKIATKQNPGCNVPKGMFRSKIFLDFDIIALSFVFDKYCPIMTN